MGPARLRKILAARAAKPVYTRENPKIEAEVLENRGRYWNNEWVVEELDGHMTAELREWVTKRRDEECKKLLTETVQTFLNDASSKQTRGIYDLALKLNAEERNDEALHGRVKNDDTQRLEEKRREPSRAGDQGDGPPTSEEAVASDEDQFLKELANMEDDE